MGPTCLWAEQHADRAMENLEVVMAYHEEECAQVILVGLAETVVGRLMNNIQGLPELE